MLCYPLLKKKKTRKRDKWFGNFFRFTIQLVTCSLALQCSAVWIVLHLYTNTLWVLIKAFHVVFLSKILEQELYLSIELDSFKSERETFIAPSVNYSFYDHIYCIEIKLPIFTPLTDRSVYRINTSPNSCDDSSKFAPMGGWFRCWNCTCCVFALQTSFWVESVAFLGAVSLLKDF